MYNILLYSKYINILYINNDIKNIKNIYICINMYYIHIYYTQIGDIYLSC